MPNVPKPVPGRKYTAAQFDAMRRAHPDLVMPGYVLRIDADGSFSFVPWHKAAGGGAIDPRRPEDNLPLRTYGLGWDEDPFPLEPIKKRTPQQRTDSMMQRLLEGQRTLGQEMGLSEERVRELTARSWKRGQPVTAEHVRAAAATLLRVAEAKHEVSERKRIVRTSPSD